MQDESIYEFASVPYHEPPNPTVDNQLLTTTQQFSTGMGKTAVKMDSQGLWLGANTFASAPFKVDMNGNITITNNGSNTSEMVWNDGTTNRIVIGKVS